MRICWSDLETYSEVNLQQSNVHVYSEHPSCEVLLWAYAFDDGPVKVYDRTAHQEGVVSEEAAELRDAIEDPDCLFVFHNSHFDRTVLRNAGNIDLLIERVRDTMVQALAHALPAQLSQLCDALRVPTDKAKDKEGRQFVLLFCKPRPKNHKLRRATRETHPEEWARFIEYARLDVEAMRECARRMPSWNYRNSELDLWFLDQKINDRGVCIDQELARSAIDAVQVAQKELGVKVQEKTDGEVLAATQRDAMLEHILMSYGVMLPDMQKATLERRLNDPDLPDGVRELIAIRLQAATTSTSKYKRFINGTSADGRYRGALQYDGAARTRRWAGRGVQLQNLPRPSMGADEIEAGIQALKLGAAHLVYDDVMDLSSNAIRGCIVTPPGKKLVVSDLSNIEGRMAAWLAFDEPMLQAFRNYDEGLGPDIYVQEYAATFNVSFDEVDGKKRQIGKVLALMLQYGGGVGAFITGAATYRIDLAELTETVWPVLERDILEEAQSFYRWWVIDQGNGDYGLPEKTFIVCDALKRLWRRKHPDIVNLWADLEQAAVKAVLKPGEAFTARRFKCRRDGAWLRILLPSGNYLCYPEPLVDAKGGLSYMGMNQYTRRWQRLSTWGGKLLENADQSLSRDVMAGNMPAIEDAGYDIVLTVHDELITETPDEDRFNAADLSARLATVRACFEGLPLAAAGFEAYRYKKE